jgi:hypothetical protein
MALVRRPRVLAGAFAAAAALIALAGLGTLDGRHAALADLPPYLARYVEGQRLEPSAPAPLSARFVLDDPKDPHLIGEWTNTGDVPLVHLVLRVHSAEVEEPEELADVELAAHAKHRVDPDDWTFDPGEVIEASWEGHPEPVVFTLPSAPRSSGDD